jgi:hypothetical protein
VDPRFTSNDEVRLKSQPDRAGKITGEPVLLQGEYWYPIYFGPGLRGRHPESDLEPYKQTTDPLQLLRDGGSHEKCFEDTLRRNVKLCGAVKLLPLTPLEFHDQTESCESSISHRLAVAHGLSFPRALWPHFIESASVAPPSPERVKTTEPISDNQPG